MILGVSVLLSGVSCVEYGLGEDTSTPINAAFQVVVSSLGANTATVDFVTEQDNIATYRFVGPVKGLDLNYLAMDAIQKKAYIVEHGKDVPAGEPFNLSGMKSMTDYVVGAYGIDKSGTIVTAPTFATFKTKALDVSLQVEKVSEESGNYSAKATVTIDESTASYAYIFDQDHASLSDAELIALLKSKGEGVKTETKSATFTFNSKKAGAVICAVLPFDQLGEESVLLKNKFTFAQKVDENSTYVLVGDAPYELNEVSAGVFEGDIKVSAESSITVMYQKKAYGFRPFSGNGGVGAVNNVNAAMPYYSNKDDASRFIYTCKKAAGQVLGIEDGGVAFWTNLPADGELYVKFDFSRSKPIYYMRLNEAVDPAIVLEETFDLCVSGGAFWEASALGAGTGLVFTDFPNGYDEGTKGAVSYTGISGDIFNWGVSNPGVPDATEEFITARELLGWKFRSVAETAGCIRIGKSSTTKPEYMGSATTPPLSALTGPTNVTVSFDMLRFGGQDPNVKVRVLGGGSFTDAKVNVDGASTETSVSASGEVFTVTSELCSQITNSVVHKGWSHFTLSVAGATPQTTIMIDGTECENAKNGRFMFDNVLIKK